MKSQPRAELVLVSGGHAHVQVLRRWAWSRRAPYHALYSPAIGSIEGDYAGGRTGDHRAGGRLFVAGSGIARGRHGDAPIEAIGPTICAALGVSLPDADGRPLELPRARAAAPALHERRFEVRRDRQCGGRTR